VLVSDFDFDLPPALIAQEPASERAAARLLILDRRTTSLAHRWVASLPELLHEGDVLVVNNTRVFPARLLGRRDPSGGAVECLLIGRDETDAGLATSHRPGAECWEALVHPGQRLRPGARIIFDGERPLWGEILARHSVPRPGDTQDLGTHLRRQTHGRRLVQLWTEDGSPVATAVDAIGHVPLPPYVKRADRLDDRERYQTVFARKRGSVAAPTAGLHLSAPLMAELFTRGVTIVEITLHVGYGTFQPVRVERVEDHALAAERYEIGDATAAEINRALEERRRVIAVGTTTTRTLEAVALANEGRLVAGSGATSLFIYPGFRFQIVGGLLTNFHLPKSSLLMLVAAFGGHERVLQAYRKAVGVGYRFYSYGDAMLLL
jgi:S-adenosylmethionine:tRNA ribosyltransferase-isomerase